MSNNWMAHLDEIICRACGAIIKSRDRDEKPRDHFDGCVVGRVEKQNWGQRRQQDYNLIRYTR